MLPVLLYHRVGPAIAGTYPSLSVPPEEFERQLGWLVDAGYSLVSLAACRDWLVSGRSLPRRPAMLTFDDGYADLAAHAFPLLESRDLPAAVFVVTGPTGGVNSWDVASGSAPMELLTPEQIRHWSARRISFGGHSRTHPNLTMIPEPGLRDEIAGSKSDLAALTGTEPIAFAYPFGRSSTVVRRETARSFELAFGIDEGRNSVRSDRYDLRRSMVQPGESRRRFLVRLATGRDPVRIVRRLLRR